MKRQSRHLLPRWVKQEDNIRVLVNIREPDAEAVSSKHQTYGAIKQTGTSPVSSTNVSTSVVVPEVKQLPANPGVGTLVLHNKKLYLYDGSGWQAVISVEAGEVEMVDRLPSPQRGKLIFLRPDNKLYYGKDGTSWIDVTGGVSGFDTAFPASPSIGQMFYRTDQKRLYVYDGTNWVAQEAIQTTTPATPVTGEMWVNGTSGQVLINLSGSIETLSLLGSLNPSSGNIVNGTSGSDTSYASRNDHRHSFRINERRTQDEGDAALYYDDTEVLWLKVNKASSIGGIGAFWGAIPATFQEQCRISQKSVSADNNDVVIAQHPSIPIDVFNYRVLSTESDQTDFWAEQVFRLVWIKNPHGGGSPRLRFKIYVKGQATFIYRFEVKLNLYYLPTGAVYTNSTDISVETNANGFGIGNGAVAVTPFYTQPFVIGVRLIRQRSLEIVGTRPDNCYVLPIYSMEE